MLGMGLLDGNGIIKYLLEEVLESGHVGRNSAISRPIMMRLGMLDGNGIIK